MMRALLRLALRVGVLAVLVGLVVFGGAWALPEVARVERNAVIRAEPEDIFKLIGDLSAQKAWLPLAGAEPAIAATVTGPAGPGQSLVWTSTDPAIPSGSAKVSALEAPGHFEATLTIPGFPEGRETITLTPSLHGTSLTYSVRFPIEGLLRRWRVYFTFENQMGAVIMRGLDSLKRRAEES
jgi:hypothetical protein